MKCVSLLLVLLAGLIMSCRSQTANNGEFVVHSNGLIYSPQDMKILGRLVDSLNIRFKSCTLDRTYTSFEQAPAMYVQFSSKSNNLKMIRDELSAGKDFDYIIKTYASFIEKKELATQIVRINRPGEELYYLTGNADEGYNYNRLPANAFSNGKKWTFDYSEKGQYTQTHDLYCYYLPSPFTLKNIPDKYARLIQYVDCMIDTGSTIILTDKRGLRDSEDLSSVKRINQYLNDTMGLKKKKDNHSYDYIYNEKIEFAQNKLRDDPGFTQLVLQAVDECISKKTSNGALEEIASKFVSKSKLLEMKRLRHVVGGCSMDDGPRIHALNIAMLSAETHNWDIFLRAHLDIMNDRFDRVSDGSWAWQGRKTYLKELEALGLNVTDLMIGLTLRSPSVASNHYFGSVSRIGRALSEGEDKKNFEMRVQQMMKDAELDEFNRGLIFILYATYLNYLSSEEERAAKIKSLQSEVADYPASLHTAIAALKVDRKKK